jgi:hypothetical protein
MTERLKDSDYLDDDLKEVWILDFGLWRKIQEVQKVLLFAPLSPSLASRSLDIWDIDVAHIYHYSPWMPFSVMSLCEISTEINVHILFVKPYPMSAEIRSVTRFLGLKNLMIAEISREVDDVYG